MLVEAGAVDGRASLMHSAARGSDLSVLTLLLSRDVDVDVRSLSGATPLVTAAFSDARRAAEFLIEHKANVNAADSEGRTPLMGSAARGDAELITLLREKGASVNATDSLGLTAWHYAIRNQFPDVAKTLPEPATK